MPHDHHHQFISSTTKQYKLSENIDTNTELKRE